jgi:hypothetical protein
MFPMSNDEKELFEKVEACFFGGLDILDLSNRFKARRLSLKDVHRIAVKAGAIPRYCRHSGKTVYFKSKRV